MMLCKRANIVTLVGILRHHFTDTEEASAVQQCTDMLCQAVDVDAVNFDAQMMVFIVEHDIRKEEQQQLDQFQYPLPMIEHPEPVTNNRETGYQTIPGSLLLKDNHHDQDICLDHINRMNSIPLSVNPDVVAFVQNQWSRLDKPKDGELYQDFKKRQKAFKKYDAASRDVLDGLMAAGNRFWLTHKYDKRGRTYCQGYHVSTQGSDWNKAVIEFAEGEPLNE
jgi:DNA-directed RNA polymerase